MGVYYPGVNTRHHIVPLRSTLLLLVLLAPASLAQVPPESAFLPEGIEATGDTAEVRALTAWAGEHRQTDSEQSLQAAERALALARELDDQRGIGKSLTVLGDLASDLDRKEAYYREAREAFEQIGDERGVLNNQMRLGRVARLRGELEEALNAEFDALEGFTRLSDTTGQVWALSGIGNIHLIRGNVEEAVSFYERAAVLAETLDKPLRLAGILRNLGAALSEKGSYEEAEIHLRRALAICEEQGDRNLAAAISNNLGYLLNKQGHYQRALPFLLAAERRGNEMGHERLLHAVSDELGKAYLGLRQYDLALHYARKSLALARTPRQELIAHETLSRIHRASGNYEQALSHYERYVTAKDSIFSEEQAALITEMQTRYETEEKQRANERLRQELQIQALRTSRWRIGMVAGVGGLLLLLGFLYYRYRIKQRANSLLEDLDRAKGRFFANISHEFRTPLTVILGGMQDVIAGRFDGNKEKLSEQQRAILRNAHQLQHLVDEVLDLNRLEAGKLDLNPAPGDLVRSLRRLVRADAPLAERNGIDLTFEPDADACPRLYDDDKLGKIVGNLLSNALKFTPEGGAVRVELRAGSPIEISVSDTGPGIPEEEQAKVFERFAQVGGGAHHGGTGIGLALAKELTELHGGTIRLESEPGEGSTFTVRLPLPACRVADIYEGERSETISERVPSPSWGEGQNASPTQGRAAAQRAAGEGAQVEEFTAGGDGLSDATASQQPSEENVDRTTVLIIEDNPDVRAFVRRSLEETYRVLEAADGETGLQHARSELPDLVVSDVMLPGIDGYEIARRLKAESDTECIPVVMLTARAAEEDQTEGYGSGAEVYITKPFSPETLRAAVARLLEERQRLRRRLQENAQPDGEHVAGNGHPTLTDRARAVVLDNLPDEDFSVEELASALGMSLRTLQRRLKPETGLAPGDFVRILRLDEARKLLTGGAGSVSEVAYAVGFKSLSYFTYSFREHYGELPSAVLGVREG